ncbi:MAG TPA: Nudix family hydrolase [Burkholderiales bacterium]
MSAREIAVAAAVIEHPDGRFLLAQRPEGKVYAGYWEFPGGKVEPGEPVAEALRRELDEELGVQVVRAYPWITRVYKYPHGTVRLHFHRVVEWRGEPHPHEGQTLAWQRHGALDVSPMLPANAPILKALSLPVVCGITHAWKVGASRATGELTAAIHGGLRLVQIRENAMREPERRQFAAQVVRQMHAARGIVLVNGDQDLAKELGADGIHLSATALMSAAARPQMSWCGASCHDEQELARAVELGVDFALLGPLQATPTHPGSAGLGWERFAGLVRGCPLPVFALGGLQPQDLHLARSSGAHGIAMIRGAWKVQASSSG